VCGVSIARKEGDGVGEATVENGHMTVIWLGVPGAAMTVENGQPTVISAEMR
jgi:hypothetical protein